MKRYGFKQARQRYKHFLSLIQALDGFLISTAI